MHGIQNSQFLRVVIPQTAPELAFRITALALAALTVLASLALGGIVTLPFTHALTLLTLSTPLMISALVLSYATRYPIPSLHIQEFTASHPEQKTTDPEKAPKPSSPPKEQQPPAKDVLNNFKKILTPHGLAPSPAAVGRLILGMNVPKGSPLEHAANALEISVLHALEEDDQEINRSAKEDSEKTDNSLSEEGNLKPQVARGLFEELRERCLKRRPIDYSLTPEKKPWKELTVFDSALETIERMKERQHCEEGESADEEGWELTPLSPVKLIPPPAKSTTPPPAKSTTLPPDSNEEDKNKNLENETPQEKPLPLDLACENFYKTLSTHLSRRKTSLNPDDTDVTFLDSGGTPILSISPQKRQKQRKYREALSTPVTRRELFPSSSSNSSGSSDSEN